MKRILVLDDNRELLDLTAAWLSKLAGVTIESSSDSAAAISLLATQRFDLVISDFRMPRASGLDLVNAVRKYDTEAKIPVIIVTGYAGQLHAKKDTLVNVHIVEKPASRHKLTDLVLSLLDNPHASVAEYMPATDPKAS